MHKFCHKYQKLGWTAWQALTCFWSNCFNLASEAKCRSHGPNPVCVCVGEREKNREREKSLLRSTKSDIFSPIQDWVTLEPMFSKLNPATLDSEHVLVWGADLAAEQWAVRVPGPITSRSFKVLDGHEVPPHFLVEDGGWEWDSTAAGERRCRGPRALQRLREWRPPLWRWVRRRAEQRRLRGECVTSLGTFEQSVRG